MHECTVHCAGCPSGFTDLSSVNGGCYKVVNVNRNWNNAGLGCRSLHKDAHLLVINDAAEQLAIAGMIDSIDSEWQSYTFCILWAWDQPCLTDTSSLKPNTHRRRRLDETVLSRRVGVGGVYMNSQLAHDDCRRIRRCEQHSVFWAIAVTACSDLIQSLILLP